MSRLPSILLLVVAITALAWQPVDRYVRSATLLQTLSDGTEPADVVTRDLSIAGRDGPIRARLYWSEQTLPLRPLVLGHGVHYQGIDERRLVPFARALASRGLLVLTPELADVADYRITERSVDVLVDSVLFLTEQPERLTAEDEVGMIGFSFAGGLSLVAAARPELDHRVAYVVSVGGHHDLERVMRFLVTSRVEEPDGTHDLDAHEYGLVVAVYDFIEHFVPVEDRVVMSEAFRAWLQEDRARARRIASRRTTAEGEAMFALLEAQSLRQLREELLRLLADHRGALARLSPKDKLQAIEAPVYLLHGTGDTVIPPAELRWAELELEGHPHRALVTPLMEHVAVDQPAGWEEKVALVDFMAQLF